MARKVFCIFGVFVLGLMASREVRAEMLPIVPVKYVASILSDAEELNLHYPAFVSSEPVLNEIYVIDGRSRVLIYTHDLYPLFTIDKRDGIEAPQGLAVDADGYVYVAQGPRKEDRRPKISIYDPILRWERDIYLDGFEGAESFLPYRMAFDGKGHLLVAGIGFQGVLVLDRRGNFLEKISPEEDGKKAEIVNVQAIRDRIYLVSESMGRIYVYDRNRSFLFAFGTKGGGPKYLSRPQSVAVDSAGRIFVTDYMRHCVAAYDSEGNWLFEFGGLGWSPGWFQFPKEIAIDKDDRIMVGDLFNNRIQIFRTLTPEELAAIKAQQMAKKKLPLPEQKLDIESLLPISERGVGGKGDVSLKLKNSPLPSGDTSFGPGLPDIRKGPGAHLYRDGLSSDPPPDNTRTKPLLNLGPLSMNLKEEPQVRKEGMSSPE